MTTTTDSASTSRLNFDMLGDIVGDHTEVEAGRVPPEVFADLSRPHTKERPGIPFSWMVSYSGTKALNNIRVFENGARHCQLQFPIRVYMSTWTPAILTSFVPIESVREAHILDWFTSFYEVPVEEAKARLQQHPEWPYDGRNADLARAELMTQGGPEALLAASRKRLREMGVTDPATWRTEPVG